MIKFNELLEETRRHQADAEGLYDTWLAARKITRTGALIWREVNGRNYLYRLRGSSGYGPSLGRESEENHQLYADHQAALATEKNTWNRLHMYGGLVNRVGRGPSIPSYVGELLRQLDMDGALGSEVLVIGTHAMAAYAAEAGVVFSPSVTSTQDLDISRSPRPAHPLKLLEALKKTDSTFVSNQEKTFQLRNKHGHEVEILSCANSLPIKDDDVQPVPALGQDWLHMGRPVERIVFDTKLLPAKIVAPDPRYFAFHKMWLSVQPERNPLKKAKDKAQALELMRAVLTYMPHYPVDVEFCASLPAPLKAHVCDFDACFQSLSPMVEKANRRGP